MGPDIFVPDSGNTNVHIDQGFGTRSRNIYSRLHRYHLQRNTEQFIWARALEMGPDIFGLDSGTQYAKT
jgi:hypothetical protein